MTLPSIMLDHLRIRLEPYNTTGIDMSPELVSDITIFLGQVAELSRCIEALAEIKVSEQSLRALALALPEHSNVVLLRPSQKPKQSPDGGDAA
ncbi:hypothetical protein H4S14_003626 [Agrobacterium vitis]|nr:hypothetical protein [Agrobacterium vitis]MBE1439858.1 hypothetical protein [Agrobacterium vitis]